MMSCIDIHTHTFYSDPQTSILLNVFPTEKEKLLLPCYKSAGLHPWHVQPSTWQNDILDVQLALEEEQVIAAGETGLDKAVKTDYGIQTKAFLAQLSMAEAKNKPVVIHCVRSYSEMLGFRKKSRIGNPWIFHWFNADEQTANQLIRKNCYLSFGHMLFKEDSKAYRTFQTVDLSNVFFETDDAGISIREVYSKAASLRKMDPVLLQEQILNNFERCFNIRLNGTLVKSH